MYSRKRQRDWGDSGGLHASRRRNNGYYVSHEANQQSPAPFHKPIPQAVNPTIRNQGGTNFSGQRNNVNDSFEFQEDREDQACCEKLQCLLVFGTVGICVLILFPDFVHTIRAQFTDSEEAVGFVGSAVSLIGGLCMWLYMSSIALLVFYSFSRTMT